MNEPNPADETGDWIAALGLREDPFAGGPDPRFFYAEPAVVQRLDLLTHLSQFSDTLLVVLGGEGAGKTTLAQQFRGHASENWRLCEVRGGDIEGFQGLLQRLAECFGLGARQQAPDLPERIVEHCAGLREVMELPVLVIDDAHRLSPFILRALSVLAGDPQRTVQSLRIILFGEPSLEGLLAEAGLAPGLAPFVQILSLPRFNEVQAAAYLMYRLTVAGYAGESPFSVTEVRAIAKHSDGLPGRMNQLARDALVEHAGRQAAVAAHTGPDRGAALRRLLVAGVAGVFVASGWYWLHQAGQPEPEQVEPETGPEELPLALPPLTRRETIPLREVPDRTPPSAMDETPPAEPAPDETPTDEGAPAVPEAAMAEEAEGIPEEIPPAATETQPPAVPEIPPPALEPAEPPEPPEQVVPPLPPEPHRPAEAAIEPAPAPAEPASVQTVPGQVASGQATPAPAAGPDGLLREDWIRAQPDDHYTLQLLGSRHVEAMAEFVHKHKLTGELAYYRRIHEGGDWYTLLYGSFPDRAAASAAIAGLPAAVRSDRPWPRSFASVRNQLPKP